MGLLLERAIIFTDIYIYIYTILLNTSSFIPAVGLEVSPVYLPVHSDMDLLIYQIFPGNHIQVGTPLENNLVRDCDITTFLLLAVICALTALPLVCIFSDIVENAVYVPQTNVEFAL